MGQYVLTYFKVQLIRITQHTQLCREVLDLVLLFNFSVIRRSALRRV